MYVNLHINPSVSSLPLIVGMCWDTSPASFIISACQEVSSLSGSFLLWLEAESPGLRRTQEDSGLPALAIFLFFFPLTLYCLPVWKGPLSLCMGDSEMQLQWRWRLLRSVLSCYKFSGQVHIRKVRTCSMPYWMFWSTHI